MLKRFSVSNYKNFQREIIVDFFDIAGYQYNTDCIIDNKCIGKMLIYGRNATGKTNLGSAISNIRFIFRPFVFPFKEWYFLNADSNDNIITFKYNFLFDDNEIEYEYCRSSQQNILFETLKIDEHTIFSIDLQKETFSNLDLSFLNINQIVIEKYIDALHNEEINEDIQETNIPFLRWLISNVGLPIESPLLKLRRYVLQMTFLTAPQAIQRNRLFFGEKFFEWLYQQNENLKDFEMFLNAMGIECKLLVKKLPDEQYELYFSHGEKVVPFRKTASSGTLALMDLYRAVIWRRKNMINTSFLYLDEFDAFYHYEMAERVIQYFKKRMPTCQIVLTTHNTNLMSNEFMRPDCLFILSRQGILTSLMHATKRELREGHNLEKMYISGEFSKYE